MIISNEPLTENSPVKFKIKGFPVQEAIKLSVERFYKIKPDAKREFLIHNEFNEVIFLGTVDESGRAEIEDTGRPGKSFTNKPESKPE
jgi:hypothetical protein